MNLPHRWNIYLGKLTLLAAALAALGMLSVAPALRANPNKDEECQKRISKADHRLHEAIEHHGYRSNQAEAARHELAAERDRCWNTYHKWWDEDSRSWHTDRDWKDEDHERWREEHEHP
jgi:hypothetical protein